MSLLLNKICRTCMIEAPALLSIYESGVGIKTDSNSITLISMLVAFTNVEVRENDGLPANICLACVSDINRAFSFKQKCERAEITLKSYIQRILNEEQQHEVMKEKNPITESVNREGIIKEELEHTIEQNNIHNLTSQPLPDLRELTDLFKHEDKTVSNKQHDPEVITQRENQDAAEEMCVLIYECGICSMGFPLKEDYRAHMTDQHFALFCCDTYYESRETFDNHQKMNHGIENRIETTDQIIKERYICQTCELEFVEILDYDQHMREHTLMLGSAEELVEPNDKVNETPAILFTCNKCNATFAKEKTLRLHYNSNKCTEQSYPCKVCNKVFVHKKNLLSHAAIHDGENKFQCKECSHDCENEEKFRAHIKEHLGSKKHHCPYCGKGFNMVSTLKDHVRTHNGEQPYLCSMCGKGFSQSTNLKQHIMRHKQIKPHKCSICSYAFVSKGELDTHLRKHTGEHPFRCNVCATGFTTSSSLAKHFRRHTGEKPYACDFCPMRFTAIGTLKNHRRTHTGERPFACRFCDKKFTQKHDMMQHMRLHTGEQPYICSYCGITFLHMSKLKLHTRNVHKSSSLKDAAPMVSAKNESNIKLESTIEL